MAQDVTDDFQIRSRIYLPAGMCMPEGMCTNHLRRDSCLFCIFSNPVSDPATGQRLVRYYRTQEDPTRFNVARTFILKIS